MLAADVEAFKESLKTKDREEIMRVAVENYSGRHDLEMRIKEMENSSHAMFLDFEAMKNRLEGAEREIAELRKQNIHLSGVYTSQAQEMYGRSSEKTSGVKSEVSEVSDYSDPLSEDAPDENENDHSEKQAGKHNGKGGKIVGFPRTGKPKGKKIDLSKLPQCELYEYDIDKLNETYGEGNWRFCYWERNETAEVVKQYTYCKVTYTPVVSSGLEHVLSRIPFEGRIIPKSPVSSSLLSCLFCDYGNMHIPFYRMEGDDERFGIPISRQNMTNWLIYASSNLLLPVYKYLTSLLKKAPYQQCDETPYSVITEAEHLVNYIWTHRTSELYDAEQIIIYCYEASRSADHLLKFYEGITEHIYLSTDAYGAYGTLEEAFNGLITVCGCFMHARRRPVDSMRVVGKGLSDEELAQLPEMQAIKIIGNMYVEENKLGKLSAEARHEQRLESVRPAVNDFFDYMNSLDENDPTFSDKFRDAIQYAKNQEKRLRMFLEDGNIPIDNGACERSIKSVATHRKNSLFSYSEKGANATMTLLSLIETAKANGAKPYYYIKYVLEKMAKSVNYGHPCNLEDMVPWSDAYRKYEAEQSLCPHATGIPPGNEKPHTPKKKDIA